MSSGACVNFFCWLQNWKQSFITCLWSTSKAWCGKVYAVEEVLTEVDSLVKQSRWNFICDLNLFNNSSSFLQNKRKHWKKGVLWCLTIMISKISPYFHNSRQRSKQKILFGYFYTKTCLEGSHNLAGWFFIRLTIMILWYWVKFT